MAIKRMSGIDSRMQGKYIDSSQARIGDKMCRVEREIEEREKGGRASLSE